MKSRELVLSIILILTLLAVPFVADAQQPGKIPKIGYLSQWSGAAGPPSPNLTAFLEGLKELGYVVGKNIAIEYRYTEGKNDRLPELATELVQLKIDLIVTETGGASLQAKKVTQTIPIVMGNSGDAVSQGLVVSLAHPGGNVTGLTALSPAASGKRLHLLAEIVPKLTHVGVLWGGTGFPVTERELAETRAAANPLNVQVSLIEIRSAADLPGVFAEAAQQNIQALLFFDMPSLATRAIAAQIAELSVQNRMPMIFQLPVFVQEGGLISYGVNNPELNRKAATYVDRILKGANPADLPVEQPTKFMLVINRKAAKALNLTIPQSVLSQANQVIE
jgi:putative tryptophan/tyrosine transport system substrate-binding protein